MARTRSPRTRTIGQMLYDARVEKGTNGKPLPITKAAAELGVGGRQTYYHWEDDYAVPDLERAADIADFCGVDVVEVVNDILRRKGIPTYDDYLNSKSRHRSARLRRDGSRPVEDDGTGSNANPGLRMRGAVDRVTTCLAGWTPDPTFWSFPAGVGV